MYKIKLYIKQLYNHWYEKMNDFKNIIFKKWMLKKMND